MEERYIRDESGKVYERFKDALFNGYAPVRPELKKAQAWLSYQGPKIPIEPQWKTITAFFIWAFGETNGECQVRLYFNRKEGLWRPWAFPQEWSYGMKTDEIPERCDEEREKVGLRRGWEEGGTAHHHCKMSAGQSPVDRDNEEKINGVHITVGDLDKSVFSLDGRVYFRGQKYDIGWSHWFPLPEELKSLPYRFHDDVVKYYLAEAPPKDYPFPEEWKDNLIKKVYTPHAQSYFPGGGPVHLPRPSGNHKGEEEVPTDGGTNVRITDKHLSRKEKKALRKTFGTKMASTFDANDLLQLNEATRLVRLLLASKNIEMSDLMRWTRVHPVMLNDEYNKATEEFEEILEKYGVDADDVEDWLKTTEAMEPTK